MFIEIDGGTFLNADCIEEISTGQRKGDPASIYTKNGNVRHSHYVQYDDLENLAAHVIPAREGFDLLCFWFFEHEDYSVATVREHIDVIPIIGWRIRSKYHEPLTLDEPPQSITEGESAVRYPNGMVVEQATRTWTSVDEWAKHVLVRWLKWSDSLRGSFDEHRGV